PRAPTLAESDLCTGGLDWAEGAGKQQTVVDLSMRARRMRAFGDFWGYMLVAQGSLEIMLEFAPLAEWDVAAPKMIVREAGGRFTGVDGDPDPRTGSVLATNGLVHEELLALLR
ncbi:MAG TPA: inositol monophosphatase family protein, partial [Actinomycetota bacterium]|nr:inositol monophosphatase family protein [Actinomycetota bacterium]